MNPLVRGLFEQFVETEELKQLREDDAFELFAASLCIPAGLLAQAPLTDFRLDPSTPGVDVAVMELNGQLIRDAEDMHEVAGDSARIECRLHFLQAKRTPSVSSNEMLGAIDIVKRFLDGRRFAGYPALDSLSVALSELYRDYAAKLTSSPTVEVRFVTTASGAATGAEEVQARRAGGESDLAALGHVGEVVVEVWGGDNLHSAWQRKHNANNVDISLYKQLNLPGMPGIDQAILGIASLAELFKMLVDGSGELDERVFYDNVRGFQGPGNRVNHRIIETVSSGPSELLPVLNNGITIVAEKYSPLPGDSMSLSGYQIVNGCQTSHCLYLAGKEFDDAKAARTFVPVRVVVTKDQDVKSSIILATNSQTHVDETQLVALTGFQKKLEDFYRLDSAGVGLHYERRPGQYHEQPIPKTRIVSIQDQLRSMAAVTLKLPHVAARYPSRLFDEVKDEVFVDGHELQPYLASSFSAYRLENAFRTGLDPKFKPARYHMLMASAVLVLGHTFSALNSKSAASEAESLMEQLAKADQVALFREAGAKIIEVAGGELPTRDRLKGKPFTTELISALVRK